MILQWLNSSAALLGWERSRASPALGDGELSRTVRIQAPGVWQLPVSSRLEHHSGSQRLLFKQIGAYLNSLAANSCVTALLFLGPGEGTRRSYQPRDRFNTRFNKTSLRLPCSSSPGGGTQCRRRLASLIESSPEFIQALPECFSTLPTVKS